MSKGGEGTSAVIVILGAWATYMYTVCLLLTILNGKGGGGGVGCIGVDQEEQLRCLVHVHVDSKLT